MKKLVNLVLTALVSLSLVACSSGSSSGSGNGGDAALYKAGTYTGVAAGRNADITVEVTVSDSKIETVTVSEHQETAGIADPALEQVPAAIVEKQSTEVDVVSGATITSQAIIDAVNTALTEAAAK